MKFNGSYRDLSGKVVIVAGSNGLLGNECVKGFIAQSSTVIGIDFNDSQNISNNNYHHIICDLTDYNETENVISSIYDQYNQIDVMVNTAYPRTDDWGKAYFDEDIEYFNNNVTMQLGSTFNLTKLCIDLMKVKKRGSIINFGSTYGILANNPNIYKRSNIKYGVTYNSIKGGVANLTRGFASYYGQYNLRINSICPGGIFSNQDNKFVEDFSNLTPLNRMGQPKEIAEVVVFLSSDSASYITGQNLLIDGGWSAW